jgi:hypothetical protein
VPSSQPKRVYGALAAMAVTLVTSLLFPALAPPPGEPPIGWRSPAVWLVLAGALALLARLAWTWARQSDAPRLLVPVLLTLVACMTPGLLYQNTGYAQFGFRFSLDYTPYLLLLVALGRWDFRRGLPLVLAGLSVAAGVWGAVAFRGYTELVYRWP